MTCELPSREKTSQLLADLRDANINRSLLLIDGLGRSEATDALRDLTVSISDDYQRIEWLKRIENNQSLHHNHNSINPLLLFLKVITHFSVFEGRFFEH